MDNEKKKYIKPEISAHEFEEDDIITCSGSEDDNDDEDVPTLGEDGDVGLPFVPFG